MERPKAVIAATMVISLGIGALALAPESSRNMEASNASENPESNCQPETIDTTNTDNMPWKVVREQVLNTRFFVSPAEFTSTNRTNFKQFLSSKGIEISSTFPSNESGSGYKASTARWRNEVTWPYDTLATVPASIVEASGLKQIVMTKPPRVNKDYSYSEPEHTTDTIRAYDTAQLLPGIAAMILDNYCGPEATNNIIKKFEAITRKAGVEYSQEQTSSTKIAKKYQHVFSEPDSLSGPRNELIDMLSNLIQGFDVSPYKLERSPLAKKAAIAKEILRSIEPNIDGLLELTGPAYKYGTHGLHPQEVIYRLECLALQEATASPVFSRGYIINVDLGEAEPDSRFPNCDEAAVKQATNTPIALASIALINTKYTHVID